MKKFFVILLVSFCLIGCSSMELEPVPSSEDKAQRILDMKLSHEENLIEAKKLKNPNTVAAVSLLLENARADKLKFEVDLLESEKLADLVITSGNGTSFKGAQQDLVDKTGIFDYDSDLMSFYIEGLKDSVNGSISHKLHLSIKHNSKTKRNYNSANLCDKWGRCDDNLLKINVISSTLSNCDINVCEYLEVIELDLSDELLRKSVESGMSIRFNYKSKSNKVKVSTSYLMGYLKVAK